MCRMVAWSSSSIRLVKQRNVLFPEFLMASTSLSCTSCITGCSFPKRDKHLLFKVGWALRQGIRAVHQRLPVPPKGRADDDVIVKQVRLFQKYLRSEEPPMDLVDDRTRPVGSLLFSMKGCNSCSMKSMNFSSLRRWAGLQVFRVRRRVGKIPVPVDVGNAYYY